MKLLCIRGGLKPGGVSLANVESRIPSFSTQPNVLHAGAQTFAQFTIQPQPNLLL